MEVSHTSNTNNLLKYSDFHSHHTNLAPSAEATHMSFFDIPEVPFPDSPSTLHFSSIHARTLPSTALPLTGDHLPSTHVWVIQKAVFPLQLLFQWFATNRSPVNPSATILRLWNHLHGAFRSMLPILDYPYIAAWKTVPFLPESAMSERTRSPTDPSREVISHIYEIMY